LSNQNLTPRAVEETHLNKKSINEEIRRIEINQKPSRGEKLANVSRTPMI